MRCGDEIRLELTAREIDPALDHAPEVSRKPGRVALRRNGVIGHRGIVEEERQHAADVRYAVRQSCRLRSLRQSFGKPRRLALQLRIWVLLLEDTQCRQTAGHRQWIA